MSRIILSKFEIYKIFETDIWGHIFLFDKRLVNSNFWKKVSFLLNFLISSNIFKPWYRKRLFYIYNYNELNYIKYNVKNLKWQRRKIFLFWKKKLLNMKNMLWKGSLNKTSLILLKSYYIYLKHNFFIKLGKKVYKRDGFFEGWYILFLECRLVSLLYRMNLLMNMFILKNFIISGNIIINGNVVTFLNYKVYLWDLISFVKPNNLILKMQLYKRIKEKRFYFWIPRFFIINYALMFGFIWDFPVYKDLAYPVGLDIFRGLKYV